MHDVWFSVPLSLVPEVQVHPAVSVFGPVFLIMDQFEDRISVLVDDFELAINHTGEPERDLIEFQEFGIVCRQCSFLQMTKS
jgi:hypothetical protein